MKGILFKPDMIQAVVEGRKTQTRRVIKPQPESKMTLARVLAGGRAVFDVDRGYDVKYFNPRYQVGETVYIKEAWRVLKEFDHLPPRDIPVDTPAIYPYGGDPEDDIRIPDCYGRLRSPLHLPEGIARHFIKIFHVRAERLQEIGQMDISREGIILQKLKPDEDYYYHIQLNRNAFAELWNSINPKYPWESNPWVFLYEFVKESNGS